MLNTYRSAIAFISAILCQPLAAETFPLPAADTDIIGQRQQIPSQHEDTLLDIARRYHLGYEEIVLANPSIDRWLPGKGTPVELPTDYILPDARRDGLVLNVPEMRIYYYPKTTKQKPEAEVQTFPVSVGRMDWATPLGQAKVAAKQKDPVWRPPASIKAEAEAQGNQLPDVVPAGPENPLGQYALRLSIPGYLIHGTDKPWGIGMRVTHGCLRLYPEDIELLYGEVPLGAPVQIVNQPVKIGWYDDALYLEAHPSLEEDQLTDQQLLVSAIESIKKALERQPIRLSWDLIHSTIVEKRGYPVRVSLPD